MYRRMFKLFTIRNKQCGFTLLETLMYIGLLSILLTSGLVTAWQLLESIQADRVRISTQEEAIFVIQKIEATLRSAESISQPSSAHSSTTALVVYVKDSTDPVTIRLNTASSSVEMRRKDTIAFVSLTTPNVRVDDLRFHYLASGVGVSAGIKAVFVLGKETFEIEKYIR